MLHQDETTFAIHGLDVDMGVVRAEVFVQKLGDLIGALRTADRLANGGKAHDYLLSKLMEGGAAATVRERPRKRKSVQSSIAYFHHAAIAVYRGDRRSVPSLDPEIVRKIGRLGSGASERFAHAEIGFSDNNVIRVDDYFRSRAEDALLIPAPASPNETQSYRGEAFGAFEGVLKEVDSRGTMLRGKLVLVPGSTEIDCVMNKDRVPAARESFDKRVSIKGIVHYQGHGGLPARLEVEEIHVLKQGADLERWKGAFVFPEADGIEDE